MIAVNLTGGLGNQFFSYAAGRKLALYNDTSLYLYVGDFIKDWSRRYQLNAFNIKAEFLYRKSNFQNLTRIFDSRSALNQVIIQNTDNIFLHGYWQSPYYFQDIREQLIIDFKLKQSLNNNNLALLKQIKTTNSVCVHIRRGDYAILSKTNAKYGDICTKCYYLKSVQHLNQNLKDPVYFIFSDDPEWVKKNLKLDCDFTIVEENKGKKPSRWDNNYMVRNSMIVLKYLYKDQSHTDFELMKNCKNFIIANSTFSWWAAWISENPDKIVCCPPKWTNIGTMEEKLFYDLLIPSSWVKINTD